MSSENRRCVFEVSKAHPLLKVGTEVTEPIADVGAIPRCCIGAETSVNLPDHFRTILSLSLSGIKYVLARSNMHCQLFLCAENF